MHFWTRSWNSWLERAFVRDTIYDSSDVDTAWINRHSPLNDAFDSNRRTPSASLHNTL